MSCGANCPYCQEEYNRGWNDGLEQAEEEVYTNAENAYQEAVADIHSALVAEAAEWEHLEGPTQAFEKVIEIVEGFLI